MLGANSPKAQLLQSDSDIQSDTVILVAVSKDFTAAWARVFAAVGPQIFYTVW